MKKKVIISTIVGAMLLSGTAMAATVAWNGHATIEKVRAQLASLAGKVGVYESNEGTLVSKYNAQHTKATQTIAAWESTYAEEYARSQELEKQVKVLTGQLAAAQAESNANGDGVSQANAEVEALGNLSEKVASATDPAVPLTGGEIAALPVLP